MTDGDDEPELWVLDDDETEAAGDGAAPSVTADVDLASTLTSDDVAGDDWADTAWLDELAPRPGSGRPSRSAPPSAGAAAAAAGADEPDPSLAEIEARRPTIDPGWATTDDTPTGAPSTDDVATVAAEAAGSAGRSNGAERRRATTSADEFAGLFEPITIEDTAAAAAPADVEQPDPVGVQDPEPAGDARPSRQRRRPTKSGDEVSEFLRELSRLALDDD